MKLRLIKALWGMEGTYEEQLARAAAAGYYGIEAPLPSLSREQSFREALERHNLAFIAQVSTQGDHLASFEEQVERATSFKPLFINSQSARDSMTEAEQDRFYEAALAIERRAGIAVGHETHRSRPMFTPWTTARLLKQFPELRITADFSHWVNVCESHLENHEEELALAMERTIHIHGRVGFPEGPQVPHPAAPEYKAELVLFTKWWKQILDRQAKKGNAFATFTAEFGPPCYMPTVPFTNKPVADLWEVNQWMTDYISANYVEWFKD
ncbi:sugar phosphate isomerase/epimerase family protein [Paenibacillus sp. PL91]|uniref:sugar phosphate isomerase/epimerase family protein n=1 Tax=Paenibacillus sp. PL91 TaxID=2729538 RepID=UPI00145E83B7|nr:TIM barrel protein [Paenibacillus sp. PL91]MBC9200821.1 TIM barrel protein [Paenibacillus sp. PL91]